jgi:CubicO group peptidase (beta-lactamase class C family)
VIPTAGSLPTRQWEELLQRHRIDYGLVGVAAAFIVGGELVWEGVDGRAELASGRPITAETRFRAGSIAKLVTALTVMILRDRGRLSLEEPVAAHLPEFLERSILIRHLLSHTAGIQREFASPEDEVPEGGRLVRSPDLAAAELFYPPGSVWKYSNFGYAMLGEIVRRVAGVPFRDFVTSEILRPLGMGRTTFTRHMPVANGHQVVPHERRVELDPSMFDPVSDAAGQLFTTAADLGRLASLFAGTEPHGPVSRQTILEMQRPVVMMDDSWSAAHGLGPMLIRDDDHVLAGHGGEVGGYAGWVLAANDLGVGAAALTNVQDAAPLLSMLRAMIRAYRDRAGGATAPEMPPPPGIAELLGDYVGDGSLASVRWRHGALWCEWLRDDDLPAPGPAPLTVESRDVLRFGRGGLYDGEPLRIMRDSSGEVMGFRVCSYVYRRYERRPPN